ncbi:MAG: GNAT family N-acetyltransferase [Candidatus Dormibacteria bacterium]
MGRPGALTLDAKRPDVALRAAHDDDASLIRTWRNDPDAVRFSTGARPVSEAEHARWFVAALADPRTRLWVAEENDVPVGQVRVDLDGDVGVVSIAVAASARGRGVGRAMLRLALAEIERQRLVTTVRALTHPDNLASVSAFEQVGFRRRDGSENGFVVLELKLG